MKPDVSRGTKKTMAQPIWGASQWQAVVPEVLSSVGWRATAQQLHQLAAYMALLQQWNGTYNLTALRAPEEMLTHHLADCLVVVAPMLHHLGLDGAEAQSLPARFKVLDVGSGGGLPGVVLAILCPAVAVTCIDAVGKKAAFIRQVAAELGLPNLKAEHARVEQLKGQYDLITSRAFASLVDFTDWTAHLLAPGSSWMAMKGKAPDEELAELAAKVSVDAVVPLAVPGLTAERCLVWLSKRGASPAVS